MAEPGHHQLLRVLVFVSQLGAAAPQHANVLWSQPREAQLHDPQSFVRQLEVHAALAMGAKDSNLNAVLVVDSLRGSTELAPKLPDVAAIQRQVPRTSLGPKPLERPEAQLSNRHPCGCWGRSVDALDKNKHNTCLASNCTHAPTYSEYAEDQQSPGGTGMPAGLSSQYFNMHPQMCHCYMTFDV